MATRLGIWQRCGNSVFWRWSGVPLESLDQIFLDPADAIMVTAAAVPGQPEAHVRKFVPPNYSGPLEALVISDEEEDQQLLSWMERSLEAWATRNETKTELLRYFSKLSPQVRDKVLGAMRKMLIGLIYEGNMTETNLRTEATPEAVWDALGRFGILEC